jgi:cyclohexyl-isocyanide hydratase
MRIGMVVFPGLTQLDLTGPYEVFIRLPEVKVLLVWENTNPVKSDGGLVLQPDTDFENCPQVDVLCVPGGRGIFDAMQNEKLLNFLRTQAQHAKYITSVCTGSLVLAAAGLLKGYRATTHWLSIDLLKRFGVEIEDERVAVDRNRITGGGVTAGIDFGLFLAAKLYNEDVAKEIQLMMEYNPAPPFHSGSPTTAESKLVDKVKSSRKEIQKERAALIDRILNKKMN